MTFCKSLDPTKTDATKPYSLAAARGLMVDPDRTAEDIARNAMKIAGDLCIYTNHNFTLEALENA